MAKRRVWKPKLGELVTVHWLDIVEMPTSSPGMVRPALFHSTGYWLGWARDPERGRFCRLSDTWDVDDKRFMGATAYPAGVVKLIEKAGK